MNWFNDLKIRKKLLLSFGILIFFMIIFTIYSAAQLSSIVGEYRNLTGSTSKRQTDLADALGTLAMLRLNNISTAYPIDNTISQSLLYFRRLDYEPLCDTFLKYLNNYREHLESDNNITSGTMLYQIGYINEIENLFIENFKPCYYEIQNGVLELNNVKISEWLLEEYKIATEMTTLLNDLREMSSDYIEINSEIIAAYSGKIVFTQFLVATVIILFSIIISIFMSKKIVMPISGLKKAATKIADGNLNYPIRFDRKDELGILSNHIGDMVDSLNKATNAKSAFLANMSHEMRTPLNVIVGLTDLRLEDQKLPGEIKEDLIKINSAGEILLGLVNDILDISKIEAGKLELILVNYNIASLLNDVIALNMIRIKSRPINFIVDIKEDLPSEFYGDELRLKQILNNLLSNAFKYTQEGNVTLRVEYTSRNEKETWLSITISDTGIGIRPEDMQKIFSNYNQVDTKANRKIEGTGLGLPIAKRLVEMMDGKITVESEYGKGSCFYVNIKQGSVISNPIGSDVVERLRKFRYTDMRQNVSDGIVRVDLSYARVLVVDDFLTNLDVAAGMLVKYKMHVDCVTSGQEAIDLIKKGKPIYNAIFMDHMMPEMDGIEATQIIRNLDSDYARNIPIVSLTANALAGSDKMFLDKGFNAFLSKPINLMKLDVILKKWVQKKNRDEAESSKTKPESSDKTAKGDSSPLVEIIKTGISIPEIPGVNIYAALELYSKDMNIYKSIINSFAINTPQIISDMRNVTEENLPDYAVNVHGLKSISAAIAADELSKRARELELMAKAGNLAGVLSQNDEFLRYAQVMVENITNWLKSSDI
ncbi:MAG: ATP-binding protein [Spirochaetaceae bacterium]|nr:ATP-binding protein [Spirochaetaceae bacterium]